MTACWEHNLSATLAVGHLVYPFGRSRSNKEQIEVPVFNIVSLGWITLPAENIGRGEHSNRLYAFVHTQRWFKVLQTNQCLVSKFRVL